MLHKLHRNLLMKILWDVELFDLKLCKDTPATIIESLIHVVGARILGRVLSYVRIEPHHGDFDLGQVVLYLLRVCHTVSSLAGIHWETVVDFIQVLRGATKLVSVTVFILLLIMLQNRSEIWTLKGLNVFYAPFAFIFIKKDSFLCSKFYSFLTLFFCERWPSFLVLIGHTALWATGH